MPSLELNKKDLEQLTGQKFGSRKELEEALWLAKTELESLDGAEIKGSLSDTNRPDLLSAEGIARELRYRLGKQKTIIQYSTKKSGIVATVDSGLKNIRPCAAYAAARNVSITDDLLRQLIQLQEKICLTFGRKRKEVAIGIFDLDQVKGNVRYFAAEPNTKFVPLDFDRPLTLNQVLQQHPKGKEYGALLEGQTKFPLLVDSQNNVLSMPPIINSAGSGKVTEKTKNLFLDVTGFDQGKVNTALNIVCAALADRKAQIGSVEIRYETQKIVTPHFANSTISVPKKLLENYFGETKKESEWKNLFSKSGFNAVFKGTKIECEYSNLRQDILHAVDIIEDLLISSDYNRLKPIEVKMATVGSEHREALYSNTVREACVGMALQEIVSYTLSSAEKQQIRIGLPNDELVELANPVSQNYAVFRKRIFPEVLEFLAKNKNASYPQHAFEIGKTLQLDPKNETGVREPVCLCIALCGSNPSYSLAKSHLQALFQSLGQKFSLSEIKHPAFEVGQTGEIKIGDKTGIIGMLNQKTLGAFGIEKPTAIIELEV